LLYLVGLTVLKFGFCATAATTTTEKIIMSTSWFMPKRKAAAALLALAAASCTSPAALPHASAFEYGDGDLQGHYFTYPAAHGNRVITSHVDAAVKGTFPNNIQTYDVNLPADVQWAVATHHPGAGFKYVVTTAEDKAYVIHPSTKQGMPATMEEIVDFQASGDQPPLVRHQAGDDGLPVIVTLPAAAKVSPLSHPVPAGEDVYAYIDTAGDLVLWNLPENAEIGRLKDVDALPDARIVRSVNGHLRPWLAFYAGAVDYPDGCILGDCTEGSRLLVVRVHPQLGDIDVFADVKLPAGDVFEGISPMFLPDDTLIATVTNPNRGAMMVRYNWEGDEISSSAAMGWDGWRHQLYYNDFGTPANPKPLMVDVRGPHANKFLQFYDISFAPVWSMVSKTSPYSSQQSGSRVVDTGLSGDLNGDGINEAVVPTETRDHIAGVQLRDMGDGTMRAEEVWRMELPGQLTSNVAAAATTDGSSVGIAMGAASGSVFRLWVPLLDDDPSSGGGVNTPGGEVPETEVPATDEPTVAPVESPTAPPPTPVPPTPVPPTPVPPTRAPPTVPPPTAPPPTRAPPTNGDMWDLAKEKEMETQMEEDFEQFESGLVKEEEAQSKRQSALLGSILGISVLLVGLLAVIYGQRSAAGIEMDSARAPHTSFNKHGVLDGMDDLELAADADMHANEEEEADEDMLSVNLDRNGVI